MSRMPPLAVEALTPEQKRVYDQIAGKRKTVRGPFPMWLRNPKLAEHANQFGIALRDHSTIGRRIFELCVITVCRAGSVQYAWSSHAPQAEMAGIAPEIVEAIRENRTPEFKKADERIAYEVATEIMATDGAEPGQLRQGCHAVRRARHRRIDQHHRLLRHGRDFPEELRRASAGRQHAAEIKGRGSWRASNR